MPSSVDPSTILSGPGKIHVDVVSAAAELFTSGSSAMLAGLTAVLEQPLAAPTTSSSFYTTPSFATIPSYDGPFYVGIVESIDELFKVVKFTFDDNNNTEIFDEASGVYVKVQDVLDETTLTSVLGFGFVTGPIRVVFTVDVPARFRTGGATYRVIFGKRVTVATLPANLASSPVILRSAERPKFPAYFRPDNDLAPTSYAAPIDTATLPGKYPDPFLAHWRARINSTFTVSFASSLYSGAMGFVNINGKNNLSSTGDYSFQGHQSAGFFSGYEKGISASSSPPGNALFTKVNPGLTAFVTNVNPDNILLNGGDYFFQFVGVYRTNVRLGVDMVKLTFPNGHEEVFVIGSFPNPANPQLAKLLTLSGRPANVTSVPGSVFVTWIRPEFFTGGDNDAFPTSTTLFKGFGHYTASALTEDPTQENAQEPPFFGSGTMLPSRSGRTGANVGTTTIAVASNGFSLPQGTINVASTAGPPSFPPFGRIIVVTTFGPQEVTYTGTTGTTFTGCLGGTGVMATGFAVTTRFPEWNLSAMRWGSHVEIANTVPEIGARKVNGEVWGDGSIQSYGGHINGLHQRRSDGGRVISGNNSIVWNPFLASKTHIQIDGSPGSGKIITLTLDAAYLADAQDGDEIVLVVYHVAGGSSRAQSQIIWPVQFYFSGNDGDIRTGASDTVYPHMKFTGILHKGATPLVPKFLMSRIDYDLTTF